MKFKTSKKAVQERIRVEIEHYRKLLEKYPESSNLENNCIGFCTAIGLFCADFHSELKEISEILENNNEQNQ